MSELLGFVPERHGWLRTLYTAMRHRRVPVRDAVLGDGSLRLDVRPKTGPAIGMIVRPRSHSEPAFAQTKRFSLGYQGDGDLVPAQRAALKRTLGVLSAVEAEMPEDLDGFAAIAVPTGDPDADLSRLFPFLDVERSRTADGDRVEVLVRVTALCNQACAFCSAPAHDQPSSEALLASFAAVARLVPGATVTLTGGEPTIRPRLFDELATARAHPGIGRVGVQTNAVMFGEKRDPSTVPAGPDLSFFVSLHAVEPALYDICTGSHGQLPRALDGIRSLLASGHDVTLNTVVTRDNVSHLPDLVRALPDLFPGDNPPALHFSSLMCPERKPEAAALLVRYGELVSALKKASQLATDLGLKVESLLSSTHASVPACTLPPEVSRGAPAPLLHPHETGYETADTPWVKAERCRGCSETAHCLGVPRPYAQRFGLDELLPLMAETA